MPGQTPTFAGLRGDESIEELRDEVAKMQKMMNHMLRNLSSKNVKEAGGYFITPTDILSKDGDVGMSSVNPDDVNPDPVRFFAGGVDMASAPWRVTNSGKMTATGALIQSSDGTYPLVILDPDSDLFGAYATASNFINIKANDAGEPLLYFDNGVNLCRIALLDDTFAIGVLGYALIASSDDLTIESSAGDVILKTSGANRVRVPSWTALYSTGASQSLQAALNAKANTFSGVTGTVYVSPTSGAPATTAISFTNGIRVS